MNAKYRPPAITKDQYAFLKIGAMAIRFQVEKDEERRSLAKEATNFGEV